MTCSEYKGTSLTRNSRVQGYFAHKKHWRFLASPWLNAGYAGGQERGQPSYDYAPEDYPPQGYQHDQAYDQGYDQYGCASLSLQGYLAHEKPDRPYRGTSLIKKQPPPPETTIGP